MSRTSPPGVAGALHDLGDTTRHAAVDVVDSMGTVVSAAVHSGRAAVRDARHSVVDTAGSATNAASERASATKDAVLGQVTDKVGTARDAIANQAEAVSGAVGSAVEETSRRRRRAVKQAARSARKARRSARSTRQSALTGAAGAIKDARATAKSVAQDAAPTIRGRRLGLAPSPSHRGRRLAQVLAVLALVGAAALVARLLRPTRSGGTGASIPPKIRPVPTPPPADSAVGGLPLSNQDETVPGQDPATLAAADPLAVVDGAETDELVWTSETDPGATPAGIDASPDGRTDR